MTPNIKCTCPFGNPAVALALDCPVHGIAAQKGVDYTDIDSLARDVWLFLTNDSMPDEAVIKKEAALHEVSAMITSAVAFNNEKLLLDHLKQLNTLAKQSTIVKQQYETNITELVKQIEFRDEEIKMLKHLRHE